MLLMLLLSCQSPAVPPGVGHACHVTYRCDGSAWGPEWEAEVRSPDDLVTLWEAGEALCGEFLATYVCVRQAAGCDHGCVPLPDAGEP